MAARAVDPRRDSSRKRPRRTRIGSGWLLAAAAWLVLLAFALVAPWLWPASEPQRVPAPAVTATAPAQPEPAPAPARAAAPREVAVRPPKQDPAPPEIAEP